MPVYYSAQADAQHGHSIYRLVGGEEVRATCVNGKSAWPDEVYVGETAADSSGFVRSSNRGRLIFRTRPVRNEEPWMRAGSRNRYRQMKP